MADPPEPSSPPPSHNGHRPLYLRRPAARPDWSPSTLGQTWTRVVAAVVVAGAAVAVVLGLVGVAGGPGPLLPSGHAVAVALAPQPGSRARADARLVWYASGRLLVVTLQASGLDPGSRHALLLTHTGSCGATQVPSRRVGAVRASGAGQAQLNAEVGSITDLRFNAWSLWLTAGPPQLGRAGGILACGVIRLRQLGGG
ncbi:MAG TPA: hypothetical protein VNN74_07320 [Candidatus Micrarchaeia archaeon]|nr:hypothetical protein [Candidatus Micrarchaeia archaeon]